MRDGDEGEREQRQVTAASNCTGGAVFSWTTTVLQAQGDAATVSTNTNQFASNGDDDFSEIQPPSPSLTNEHYGTRHRIRRRRHLVPSIDVPHLLEPLD